MSWGDPPIEPPEWGVPDRDERYKRPTLTGLLQAAFFDLLGELGEVPKSEAALAVIRDWIVECDECCGWGEVMEMKCYGGPPVEVWSPCEECDGTGHQWRR